MMKFYKSPRFQYWAFGLINASKLIFFSCCILYPVPPNQYTAGAILFIAVVDFLMLLWVGTLILAGNMLTGITAHGHSYGPKTFHKINGYYRKDYVARMQEEDSL